MPTKSTTTTDAAAAADPSTTKDTTTTDGTDVPPALDGFPPANDDAKASLDAAAAEAEPTDELDANEAAKLYNRLYDAARAVADGYEVANLDDRLTLMAGLRDALGVER